MQSATPLNCIDAFQSLRGNFIEPLRIVNSRVKSNSKKRVDPVKSNNDKMRIKHV
jgi:hypothetical protein